MSDNDHLQTIFNADRSLRQAEAALLDTKPEALVGLLAGAVSDAYSLTDEQEANMRLERLADLCAQVEGPEMVDALLRILNNETPSVRVQAAEALVDVAFERYAEVARAVERAVQRGDAGPAMRELPWVIAEVAEPSAIQLIRLFLTMEQVEIVASGVEALASLGDADAVAVLEPLKDDPRPVELDEYDGEVNATLGQLVTEAIEALSGQK